MQTNILSFHLTSHTFVEIDHEIISRVILLPSAESLEGLLSVTSDFIWPFLQPYMGVSYMGVIPNQKMAFIFPISCILVLIFPIFMTYVPICEGKGSFRKSQIKSLVTSKSMCTKYLLTAFSSLPWKK